jgi:hypothetical protein
VVSGGIKSVEWREFHFAGLWCFPQLILLASIRPHIKNPENADRPPLLTNDVRLYQTATLTIDTKPLNQICCYLTADVVDSASGWGSENIQQLSGFGDSSS